MAIGKRGRQVAGPDHAHGESLGQYRCGGPGGTRLQTTVMPFILRGVSLLGASSADCPLSWRRRLWERLAGGLYLRKLEAVVTETVSLDELPRGLR
jgi:NADPH:quinone reductase-like Zn-dependent oxidoreductase